MNMQLTDKQIHAFNAMPAEQRFDIFVDSIVSNKSVWGLLSEEGWVIISGDEEDEYLPVWSHEELASIWASGMHSDSQASSIELKDWLEEWLPGMKKNGLLIAVSPNTEGDSITLGAEELLADLQDAVDAQQ